MAARDAVVGAQDEADAAAAQIRAAEANLHQARADVSAAEAKAVQTASDLARARGMYEAGAASKQAYEAADALNTSTQSALTAARERVNSANAAVAQDKAKRSSALSQVAQAKSRLVAAVQTAAQAQAGVAVARTGLAQAQGHLQQAKAALSGSLTAPQQISMSEAQRKAAAARALQAEAAANSARLQLSYTTITAPVRGVVSQKSVQLGQYVQPGQMLMAVVPLDNIWVVANFKETQVGRMRVGQRAKVRVDAYPRGELRGRVQSIGAATGSKFSLLPSENATGNFVKVVQRIPVKITLDLKGRQAPPSLRIGMSVIPTILLAR